MDSAFTSDHIEAAYLKWKELNPAGFELFRKFAYEAASARDHYGIGGIAERVRWHTSVETVGDTFKINNSHRALIARDLAAEDPETFGNGFFEFRERRAGEANRDTE